MSSNVGLSTPRGSGTSGYVQRNLSTLKPRSTGFGAPYPPRDSEYQQQLPRQRQPDQEILAHDRQREVEVKVFELRDELEEEGKWDEEEIERRGDELRMKLLEEEEEEGNGKGGKGGRGKALKSHQVHELAEAKIKESERLRKALGIKEGREGKAWEDSRDPKVERDREDGRERGTKR
jgi:cwf21 domain